MFSSDAFSNKSPIFGSNSMSNNGGFNPNANTMGPMGFNPNFGANMLSKPVANDFQKDIQLDSQTILKDTIS